MDEALIDQIANDGRRNVAGGIYSTRVYEFASAIEAEAIAPMLDRIAELESQIATLTDSSEMEKVQKDALEEAAKVCDELAEIWNERAQSHSDGKFDFMTEAADRCADDIRALPDQPKDAREAT